MKLPNKLTYAWHTITNKLYWDLYYTIGYSMTAGIGNGLGNLQNDKSFSDGFGEGFVNNVPLGMAINVVYPIAFDFLKKREHYRRNANLLTLGINLGFLAWHYLTGTENPLQTMMPTMGVRLLMTNRFVTETQQTIDDKVQ